MDSSVNIKIVGKRIAWGKYFNAGQTCLAPDYVLCQKSVKDDLVTSIKSAVKELYGEVCVCACVCICVCMHACVCVCAHMYVHSCACVHYMCTYIHLNSGTYRCMKYTICTLYCTVSVHSE